VITDNQSCYAPDDVGELTELSDHTGKSVLRHGFRERLPLRWT
jgi:hypothetical protein